MSPYRKPDPAPSQPVESRPFRLLGSWASRNEGRLIVGVVVVVVGGAMLLGWHAATHPPPPKPCSAFADYPAKDVPARCTKNFDPAGGPEPR